MQIKYSAVKDLPSPCVKGIIVGAPPFMKRPRRAGHTFDTEGAGDVNPRSRIRICSFIVSFFFCPVLIYILHWHDCLVQLLAVAALLKSSHSLPRSFSATVTQSLFQTFPVIPPRPHKIFTHNFIISHPYYSPLPTHFYTLGRSCCPQKMLAKPFSNLLYSPFLYCRFTSNSNSIFGCLLPLSALRVYFT